MDIIASLKEKLVKDRKILSEFQTAHLNLAIDYLSNLKKDFNSARSEYEKAIKAFDR